MKKEVQGGTYSAARRRLQNQDSSIKLQILGFEVTDYTYKYESIQSKLQVSSINLPMHGGEYQVAIRRLQVSPLKRPLFISEILSKGFQTT